MFNQLGERLKNTFRDLRGRGRLTEENISDALREVRRALLEADVALPAVKEFLDNVKSRAIGEEVTKSLTPGQAVIKIVNDELVRLMGGENDSLHLAARPPAVILVAGLQGAGKTTTVAKLARFVKERERKQVLVTSTDLRRPAAVEQLSRLADDVGVDFFPVSEGARPVEVAVGAIELARRGSHDVVIVDTAGRLHVDPEMMDEVVDIHQSVSPVETLFIVDSLTGQDAVNSARAFDEALPVTGVILTKTDGDARGGAALSIRHVTGKPIKFLGVGESTDALEAFHPDRVASRILGMGDVLSLVEEVERKVDREQAEKIAKKISKGTEFSLQDFRDQLGQMEQMGGIASLMEKMPGVDQLPQGALASVNNRETVRMMAIVDSMTPHERRFPAVIRGSRKKRIAAGSGTKVQEVNRLLKQFAQMQKMMKKVKKKGGMARMLNQMKRGGAPRMPF